jgi:hypothetical protein
MRGHKWRVVKDIFIFFILPLKLHIDPQYNGLHKNLNIVRKAQSTAPTKYLASALFESQQPKSEHRMRISILRTTFFDTIVNFQDFGQS